MSEKGKYIYCIIGMNNREVNPVRNLRFLNGVNLVHYKDIAAVVSNTPIIKFDRLDKEELTKNVAVHQRVNEAVMKNYDVVPMTFGTIAPNVDEVLRILEKVYLQFKTALEKIKGKMEFAVQVWWDQKKLVEELMNTNSEIQKLKQKIFSKRGIMSLPTKLKLGKLIQKEAETQRQSFCKDIQAFLSDSAHDFTLNKLIEDDMIANFSFLIKKTREPELDKKMQELGKKYEDKLRFKYIGPMLPYSFVNINLSLGNFELVDEARKLLGLGEEVSFEEIKKAYYRLAHQYHPDKHQGSSEKEEQMKRLTEAYNVLINYCRNCYELMGKVEGRKYSFREEDVKNALIIK